MVDRKGLLIRFNQLKVGQACDVDKDIFEEVFRVHPLFSTYADTPIKDCLNGLMGSEWGEFTVEKNSVKQHYVVARHEGCDKRVYVSKDRRYLFIKMLDGTYKPIGGEESL